MAAKINPQTLTTPAAIRWDFSDMHDAQGRACGVLLYLFEGVAEAAPDGAPGALLLPPGRVFGWSACDCLDGRKSGERSAPSYCATPGERDAQVAAHMAQAKARAG